LPLSTYGLAPGDEIKLFARAEDNDPAGPNGAESGITVVRIISQEDYEKLVRAREGMEAFLSKYRQARRRVEGLADDVERLRKKVKEKPGQDRETADDLSRLAARLQKEAEAIRQAAARKLPYDLDRALSKHLTRTAQRLDDLSRQAAGLANSRLSDEELDRALAKLGRDLEEQQQELEHETVEPLEHLALILPLLEDAGRFVDLYQRQKALAERLGSLKGRDRPQEPALKSRMKDLEAEQQQLRLALVRLLEDIEDHAAALPDDPPLDTLRAEAIAFVKAVRGIRAHDAMTDAERALAELSGTRGHAAALEAAEVLDQFVKRCRSGNGLSGAGQMCLRFQPKLALGLGATVEQLLADMGLGGGASGSGGHSSQRNSLDNLGLYGNLPTAEAGQDSKSTHSNRSAAARANRGRGDPGRPGSADGSAPGEAQSATEAAVPFTYRRRVAEYFQRIADETGGR
jgi:hypothetical protein